MAVVYDSGSGSGSGSNSRSSSNSGSGSGSSSSSPIISFLVSTHARYLPFKVLDASLGHPVMKCAHGANYAILDTCWTRDIKLGQKVICYCDQCILWPAGEPVHCTTADQSRELQRTVSEFLSHLLYQKKWLLWSSVLYLAVQTHDTTSNT